MRVGVVLVGIFALLASIFSVVWFVRDRPLAIAAAEHDRMTWAAVVRRTGEGLVSLALREHTSYHGRGQVGQVHQAHHGGLDVAALERLQTGS